MSSSASRSSSRRTGTGRSRTAGCPGETLFDIEEAAQRGTVIQMLVSDAAQRAIWPTIKQCLNEGDALYFSHGFSIVYKDQTGVIPPDERGCDHGRPKGSGTSVRRNFLSGAGINSSFAVAQDFTGRARERAIALGIAIGSGYLFPTTFEQEVYSDLTGERGVLMGALAGVMEAQYDVLRANGHSPSEAFNETVEELTQSLIRLVDENGMDWMYANCSATAQRGALDWKPKFKAATLPVFKELYERVRAAPRPSGSSRAAAAPTTRRRWARSSTKSATPRCGGPARRPENCGPRNRQETLTLARGVLAAAARTRPRSFLCKSGARIGEPGRFLVLVWSRLLAGRAPKPKPPRKGERETPAEHRAAMAGFLLLQNGHTCLPWR